MVDSLVSIIIPAYNYGHFLSETILSVINQSYQNWECLIIDDGSTDNTENLVNKFTQKDFRIKYYKKENEGRSIARNFGIEKSSGEYIQFLDADDIIQSNKIEKQIHSFNLLKDVCVEYCDFDFFDSKTGKIIKTEHFTKALTYPLKEIIFDLGYSGFIIPIHSALFRRKVFNSIRFRSNLEYREDWLFWIDVALADNKFHFINEKMVLYRKHETSTVHNTYIVDYYRIKTAFIAYDIIPNEFKASYIDFFSEKYSYLLQVERNKYKKIINSKYFNVLKKLMFIKKLIFK